MDSGKVDWYQTWVCRSREERKQVWVGWVWIQPRIRRSAVGFGGGVLLRWPVTFAAWAPFMLADEETAIPLPIPLGAVSLGSRSGNECAEI